MKKCTKCEEIKELECFVKDNRNITGYVNICKVCRNRRIRDKKIASGKLVVKPKPKVKGNKICSKCGEEKPLELFYAKSSNKTDGKRYRCKVCTDEYQKQYKGRREVKDRANELQKIRVRKFPEKIKKIRRKCYNKRREDSIKLSSDRIRACVSNSLRRRGKTKNLSSEIILGCTVEEALMHLEHTFVLNYNIPYKDDYLKYLHIDHIIPLSEAKNEIEVYELNHYTNLQFLYQGHNQQKSNSLSIDVLEFPQHLI